MPPSADTAMAATVQQAKNWRRHIHQNPELQFAEHETAGFIAQRLQSFGLSPSRGLAETGVVAVIEGDGRPGPSIALRAEMDALPIEEQSNLPHRSRNPGVMHACGHDGHMAMLLAAASLLAASRDFPGRVVVIFQPSEEFGGGAKRMIDEGLLTEFPFDRVFSLHNMPGEAPGSLMTRTGPVMAAATTWDLVIDGKGAHAGWPHLGIDSISVAADFIQGCNAIIARMVDPISGATISPTRISGGNSYNTLPEEIRIGGTLRTLDDTLTGFIIARMHDLAAGLARNHGCDVKYTPHPGYPVTVNDADSVARAMQAATAVVGASNISDTVEPKLGTEDFAYMLRERPGAYVFIGAGDIPPLHSNRYDFNDEVLETGIRFLTELVRASITE